MATYANRSSSLHRNSDSLDLGTEGCFQTLSSREERNLSNASCEHNFPLVVLSRVDCKKSVLLSQFPIMEDKR